ncbi:MAG: MarR family winged helix-turn-helix transcriptional regulator [Candidatus Korobacteraceae bacterium]
MQENLKPSLRNLSDKKHRTKEWSGGIEKGGGKDGVEYTSGKNTSLSPLKLFPGVSFSVMFRFLLVSRICRRRMALFCRKNYGLEPNLFLILLAASEGHLQQGILARSLGINKNAMVFLVDKLELRRLIKRVANPDNRRERLIECTLKGGQIVAEVKTNYQEIVRWGLYPLTDPQIEQFTTFLAQIIDSAGSPPCPPVHSKKARRTTTPSVSL